MKKMDAPNRRAAKQPQYSLSVLSNDNERNDTEDTEAQNSPRSRKNLGELHHLALF